MIFLLKEISAMKKMDTLLVRLIPFAMQITGMIGPYSLFWFQILIILEPKDPKKQWILFFHFWLSCSSLRALGRFWNLAWVSGNGAGWGCWALGLLPWFWLGYGNRRRFHGLCIWFRVFFFCGSVRSWRSWLLSFWRGWPRSLGGAGFCVALFFACSLILPHCSTFFGSQPWVLEVFELAMAGMVNFQEASLLIRNGKMEW